MVKVMPGFQRQAGAGPAVVQHLRVFVEDPADAVAAVFAHDRAVVRFGMGLDGVADIAEAHARV